MKNPFAKPAFAKAQPMPGGNPAVDPRGKFFGRGDQKRWRITPADYGFRLARVMIPQRVELN